MGYLLLFLLFQQRPISAIADDMQKLVDELRARPETIVVPCGGSVANAISTAKAGNSITLSAGCRYVVGELQLPSKTGVVTIRTDAVLPERRVTTADASLMPILANGSAGKVINGTGASNWKFDGIQFESTTTSEIIALQDSENITFDRILIVAGTNGQRRAIRGNGKNITLTRSHIANIWTAGADSQAFCAWDGAGPFTITDNYLEAASENVMFGGADSASADRVPANILIEGNLFSKRLEWKPVPPATTSGKVVKNLLEFKAAKHVIVRNNTFERSWTDAQTGYGISIKSVNQDGSAPWSATEDVLFEGNTVRDVEGGFNIQGYAADQPGGRTTGVVIRSNTIQASGVAMQIIDGPGTVTVDRTTFVNGYTFMQLSGSQIGNLTVTGVLANHNDYGVKGDSAGIGTPSLVKFAAVWTWTNNVLLGGAGKGTYPPTTWYDMASVPPGVSVGR